MVLHKKLAVEQINSIKKFLPRAHRLTKPNLEFLSDPELGAGSAYISEAFDAEEYLDVETLVLTDDGLKIDPTDKIVIPIKIDGNTESFLQSKQPDALGAAPPVATFNSPKIAYLSAYMEGLQYIEEKYDDSFAISFLDFRPLQLKAFVLRSEEQARAIVFQAQSGIIPSANKLLDVSLSEFTQLVNNVDSAIGLSE